MNFDQFLIAAERLELDQCRWACHAIGQQKTGDGARPFANHEERAFFERWFAPVREVDDNLHYAWFDPTSTDPKTYNAKNARVLACCFAYAMKDD